MQFDLDIRKTLRSGKRRFDCTRNARRSQRMVVYGPSGAGKSQMMKPLPASDPDAGHIRLDGRTLFDQPPASICRSSATWPICSRTTRCSRT
jgi:molybdate transport system ATP-binding protein